MRDLRQERRRKEGWTQRTGGEKTAWEDLMVKFRGTHWRSHREKVDVNVWKSEMPDFVDHICRVADVPNTKQKT
eukprot:8199656-Pyramimonas_sp.AAC.1